jgi:hypothetical protein
MLNHTCENKSMEIKEFLNQWEYKIISALLISSGSLAEWGGRINHSFNHDDCKDSHGRIGAGWLILVQGCVQRATSSHNPIISVYGEAKFVSRFRSFRCKAYVYLNKDHQGKG